MSILKYMTNPRLLRSAIRQVRSSFIYQINTGDFWDMYALEWESGQKNRSFEFLGDEWDNEESFLNLLEEYCDVTKTALEIGCGGGRITYHAAPRLKMLHAADVSDQMLRKCSSSIRASNVIFHKLDGFTLSQFYDAELDLVFSHDVFVHFPKPSVYTYFREMHKVLGSNGMGIISFFDLERAFGVFRDLSTKMWQERRIPPHMRIYFVLQREIELMLHDAGFKVLRVKDGDFMIFVFSKAD